VHSNWKFTTNNIHRILFPAAAHLHHNLATHPKYPKIEIALQEAFLKTDLNFIEKSQREVKTYKYCCIFILEFHYCFKQRYFQNLHSGTTAVCALLRHSEKKLWVGWVGDSQVCKCIFGKKQKMSYLF
jgi:serine/threonine protein phosphatase PrpC